LWGARGHERSSFLPSSAAGRAQVQMVDGARCSQVALRTGVAKTSSFSDNGGGVRARAAGGLSGRAPTRRGSNAEGGTLCDAGWSTEDAEWWPENQWVALSRRRAVPGGRRVACRRQPSPMVALSRRQAAPGGGAPSGLSEVPVRSAGRRVVFRERRVGARRGGHHHRDGSSVRGRGSITSVVAAASEGAATTSSFGGCR